MINSSPSVLLLTILLAIGLFFFLRASSKDRTTIIEVHSKTNSVLIMDEICIWLKDRGWKNSDINIDDKYLKFSGQVSSSIYLAIFLSLLGTLGAACLGLVIIQIYSSLKWWPMLISFIGGPIAGLFYMKSSARNEEFELKLVEESIEYGCKFKLKAHRDELIALDKDLSERLQLTSDANLFETPI